MAHFTNVKSLDDLKAQYKVLALANHPDCGGNAETMKEINAEYDNLFIIWKHRYNQTASEPTTETADSTRHHFYTQNGWAGKNYRAGRTTKEIAALIRTYVKETYPTFRFSVRFESASMCSEIFTDITQAPERIYKTFDELTEDELVDVWRAAGRRGWAVQYGCLDDDEMAKLRAAYSEHDCLLVYTDLVQHIVKDVEREVKSYRYDDSDGMIDYFDTNFYYFGVRVSDKFKIVEKKARVEATKETPSETGNGENEANKSTDARLLENEYEITESEHTKTHEKIFIVRIVRTLSREEYLEEKERMRQLGGYYSKFVHGFIFKENPADRLKAA